MTLSYTGALTRSQDNDRFLCALFAPQEAREALFAIAAFNVEIAKTREVVSEPLLGEIRLQWWRDAIEAIGAGKTPPRHPVVDAVAGAMEHHGLDVGPFLNLIEARTADLAPDAPQDMEALEAYGRGTAAPLATLALNILKTSDPRAREAAGFFATAYALVGVVRAIPFHAAQKRVLIPDDVQRRTGLDLRDLLELRPSPALSASAMEMAAGARRALSEGERLAGDLPEAALAALLPGTLARLYLDRLKRANGNPFDGRSEPSRTAKHWALLKARLRGRP